MGRNGKEYCECHAERRDNNFYSGECDRCDSDLLKMLSARVKNVSCCEVTSVTYREQKQRYGWNGTNEFWLYL